MEPEAQVIVTLHKNGQVSIQGPIDNKLAVYGLLESGKDAVRQYHATKVAGPAAPAPGIVVPDPALAKQLLKRSLQNGVPRDS